MTDNDKMTDSTNDDDDDRAALPEPEGELGIESVGWRPKKLKSRGFCQNCGSTTYGSDFCTDCNCD